MKSIRKKITVCLMATVLVALVAVGAASIGLNYRSTIATVDQMMSETALLAAARIEQELTAYKNVAMDTGRIAQLSTSFSSVEDKKAIIDERVSLHGFQRGNVIGMDGISVFDGKDYSDREYVQQAMQGNVYVSQPLVSKITGELSIMVAAPIYSARGVISGVVYFVPPETFLNDIVSSIKVSENCRAYMINKDGDTIADVTLDTITTQNVEQEAQSDKSLKSRAALHEAMRRGENGFGRIQASDGPRFLAYAPVGGTDGWSVAVTVLKSEYLATTYFGIMLNIVVIVISILASIVVALKLSNNISVPMHACAKRMKLLVEGDLDTPMPKITSKDETGMLANSTAALVEGLSTVINDISYLLNELANKNLNVRTQHEDVYVGSFRNILMSMRNMKNALSDAMRQVNYSAEQVSAASDQLSASAQTLSQGTTEQASSVEELAAQVGEISEQAKHTASGALDVRKQTHHAGEEVSLCNQKMQTLMGAMDEIRTRSDEIEKILKTIDDIAFQTNILALNAAVEAARAGEAGKGFAVVAEEVRALAGKSAEASKTTTDLIESSIQRVEHGSMIASEMASQLEFVVSGANQVMETTTRIADDSRMQAAAVSDIQEQISQISCVVQTNSAIAQESAATSEELSSQTKMLKNLTDMLVCSLYSE